MNMSLAFRAVSAATVVLPWLPLWLGRVPVLLSLFWLCLLVVLIWTIMVFRKNRQLAAWGLLALLAAFVSMIVVPSLARGE
jgi:hypothetical protein